MRGGTVVCNVLRKIIQLKRSCALRTKRVCQNCIGLCYALEKNIKQVVKSKIRLTAFVRRPTTNLMVWDNGCLPYRQQDNSITRIRRARQPCGIPSALDTNRTYGRIVSGASKGRKRSDKFQHPVSELNLFLKGRIECVHAVVFLLPPVPSSAHETALLRQNIVPPNRRHRSRLSLSHAIHSSDSNCIFVLQRSPSN